MTNIQWAIWICDWSLYVGCVLVNKEMVLMIFATVYGDAIFKEALVIFVKREQCLKVEYCDWPAYPPQIVFFSDCGADVEEWKAVFTVCV